MTQATAKRVLAVIRLSDEKDESTSPERQRAIIRNWTAANGYVLAGEAEDLDVSGRTDPFERPGLGPWLATPERFDVIAVWKLDRLSRSVVHSAKLMGWCDERSKTLVSCSEGFDLGTPMGRMFFHIIAAFAQGELETITERVTASHAKLRQTGRYAGAPLPFGYVAAGLPTGGKTLVQEPRYAVLLRRILKEVTEGVSTHEIARRLNEERVPTWGDWRARLRGKPEVRQQRWAAETVQQIVRSPMCAGIKTIKTKVADADDKKGFRYLRANEMVRDEDDRPVMATAEPIVSEAEWRTAVAAMASRAMPGERTARVESLQQGVITCGSCGANLYVHQVNKTLKSGMKTYQYYRDQGRRKGRECAHPVSILVDVADRQVEEQLLGILGTTEITRTVYEPGEDYSAQIDAARARLDEIEDDYLAGRYDGAEAKARYHRIHAKATERIDSLAGLPRRPAATRTVGTGETYAEKWARCDQLERREFLLSEGFQVIAYAPGQLPNVSEPHTAPVARLVAPPTVWAAVRDGVELADGADPLDGDDWTDLRMTLRVPPGARLGSD